MAQQIHATQRAVCLLRSRRTFFFSSKINIDSDDFESMFEFLDHIKSVLDVGVPILVSKEMFIWLPLI